MIDEGIRSGTTSPPTRELIPTWAAYAKDLIKDMLFHVQGISFALVMSNW